MVFCSSFLIHLLTFNLHMFKQIILLGCCIGMLFSTLSAQDAVWVLLSDKGPHTAEQLATPEHILSPAALTRRASKGITVEETDLPVYKAYIDALGATGAQILGQSRWVNAVAVSANSQDLNRIMALPFVLDTKPVQTLKAAGYHQDADIPLPPHQRAAWEEELPFDYGDAVMQNTMLNIHKLHAKGFTGKGVRIALFDSGFDAVDTMDVFKKLWEKKQIVAWHDFVDNDETVFREDDHGTSVMSTIGANLPGEMVGMAPDATFILCRTEDAGSETQQEEYNWLAAVEWADSVGVDVIHSSLGYSEFDGDKGNYTYENMDGNTAIITRAADLAARKGIIVTTSAGNEGSGSWHYLTAPCDADSVLCVGAISKTGRRASFSSWGPSADGRVKPDVVALGSRTTVASRRNYITKSDGTSFSGPIIGGFVACLRQAHPDRSNIDIIRAVRMSGDQYNTPDAEYGYGLPDAAFADSLLRAAKDLSKVTIEGRDKNQTSKAKAKKKPMAKVVSFASDPQSTIETKGNKIQISTPKNLERITLMQGENEVFLNKKLLKVTENGAVLKTKYLLPGDTYYLKIETEGYTENVKISL